MDPTADKFRSITGEAEVRPRPDHVSWVLQCTLDNLNQHHLQITCDRHKPYPKKLEWPLRLLSRHYPKTMTLAGVLGKLTCRSHDGCGLPPTEAMLYQTNASSGTARVGWRIRLIPTVEMLEPETDKEHRPFYPETSRAPSVIAPQWNLDLEGK